MTKILSVLFALSALTATSAMAGRSYGTCYAYTDCYNRFGQLAGSISCRVNGDSSAGVACNWYVQAYTRVSCSGFAYDRWGNYVWLNLADSCARFY